MTVDSVVQDGILAVRDQFQPIFVGFLWFAQVPLHSTAQHCTALHNTVLHSLQLHTVMHSSAVQCTMLV